MDKDARNKKTWHIYSFGKSNVFRLDLNESREGFYRRGRGSSFHVDGPKTEKAREPTVESLVHGIWRLIVSVSCERGQKVVPTCEVFLTR